MQRLFDLKGHQGRVKGVVWNAGVDEDQQRSLLTIDQQCVRVWEMNASSTELKVSFFMILFRYLVPSCCMPTLHGTAGACTHFLSTTLQLTGAFCWVLYLNQTPTATLTSPAPRWSQCCSLGSSSCPPAALRRQR